MANEDLIERANALVVSLRGESLVWTAVAVPLIGALAAALREAREDTRRLDWLQKEKPTITRAAPNLRAAIDAAMKTTVEEESK